MSRYTIKELGQISGVQPHTIRIWEQRYNLLKPLRTETNIRYYDDEQLKKLLNVCELMNAGMKISHIGELTKAQVASKIDKIIASSFKDEDLFYSIINQATIAVSTFDEVLFEKIFSKSISKFGLAKTYLKLIYPLLIKVGLMWSKSDILPAQEHFLSNLIKQKLFSSIDALPLPGKTDQTWVLFLNEEEGHEIGLLFANYILRQHGKKVIYLGANVPYDNLLKVVKQCKATHLHTFFVRNQPVDKVAHLLERLNTDFKKIKICISGKKEIIENITLTKNVNWIKEINSFIRMLE